MKIYDLYGFAEQDIDVAVPVLAVALSIHWTKRDSDFVGEYYHSQYGSDGDLKLQSNFAIEAEGLEPEFSAYSTLLYISGSETVKNLEALILNCMTPQPVLLRRTIREN